GGAGGAVGAGRAGGAGRGGRGGRGGGGEGGRARVVHAVGRQAGGRTLQARTPERVGETALGRSDGPAIGDQATGGQRRTRRAAGGRPRGLGGLETGAGDSCHPRSA